MNMAYAKVKGITLKYRLHLDSNTNVGLDFY